MSQGDCHEPVVSGSKNRCPRIRLRKRPAVPTESMRAIDFIRSGRWPSGATSNYSASSAEASFAKNRYLLRTRENVPPRPVDDFNPAADRDNSRDNHDQIASPVTCTLAYT